MTDLKIHADAQAVVKSLADDMMAISQQDKPVHISLSGGSTPKQLFAALAQAPYAEGVNWQNLHFWWGDERCVAPDDAESNYGCAQALLFDHVAIPAENIHRIRGEDEPQAEAKRFAAEMAAVIPAENGLPVFDWILLGVGDDGHTASLFPGQTDYDEPGLSLVAPHPQSGQLRVSKSARLLEAAKRISYLVIGAGKTEIVAEIHSQPADSLPYPAAKIQARQGKTEWYLDAVAASKLAIGE
ncbi:6-phosphogluconolactonase [Photobacterium sp. Hal280]|uniref:6-phosphogluconolactonase n=1 Tax=Photobacterium sp. Hal280 TaxID=3035163 RepID=UPI00301DC313